MHEDHRRLNHNEAVWRVATASAPSTGNCVEVASLPGANAIRDSRNPDGPVLVFARPQWTEFIDGVKAGEFDD